MRPHEETEDFSRDQGSLASAEKLVAYEQAKADVGGQFGQSPTMVPEPVSENGHLRKVLACIDLLHRVWPDFEDSPAENEAPAKTLGEFRLIREIARGGMGVVYEAEQSSMGRMVALKVLPFAALVRDKSLHRFRNEVRAAAALDHPNIVSVYSVGEERGVHFYAMQLIRGQSLADVIVDLRSQHRAVQLPAADEVAGLAAPDSAVIAESTARVEQARLSTAAISRRSMESYQIVARMGIQAADALQHAHDLGVLHRDIKPSNLLLDREGQLYITDFGLARIESDASLTMTGDIVGTLRYMAPEQALAKRVVIDHRADIYSLGATLYELLTLEPAFAETDRSELLKRIAFEDPRPLRKLDPRIPVELETIVLKAMAKSPQERYQTAQALSDDLRAYLESRPIQAKPPTWRDRLLKWSRRHPAAVWAAMLVLAATTMISIASALLISAAYRSEALLREQASEKEQVAEKAAQKAAASAKEAAEVSSFLASVFLCIDPERDGQNITVAEALDQSVKKLHEDLPGISQTRLRVLVAVAVAYRGLGMTREANRLWEQAYEDCKLLEDLDEKDRISVMLGLANGYYQVRKTEDGLRLAEEALNRCRAAVDPLDRLTITAVHTVASFLKSSRPLDSIRMLEELVSVCTEKLGSHHDATVTSINELALAYINAHRYMDAVNVLEAVLPEEKRRKGHLDTGVLTMTNNLALAYDGVSRPNDSIQLLQKVTPPAEQKRGQFDPGVLYFKNNLARASVHAGRSAEFLAMQEHNLKNAIERFGSNDPGTIDFMQILGQMYLQVDQVEDALRILKDVLQRSNDLFELLAVRPQLNSAIARHREALLKNRQFEQVESLYRELVDLEPNRALAHQDLATALIEVAAASGTAVPWDEATSELVRSIELNKDQTYAPPFNDGRISFELWIELLTRSTQNRPELAEIWIRIGRGYLYFAKWTQAETAFREAIRLEASNVFAHAFLGYTLNRQGRYGESEAACKQAVDGCPDDVGLLTHGANVLIATAHPEMAEIACRRALDLGPINDSVFMKANALNFLGVAIHNQGRFEETAAYCREAIRLVPNYPEPYALLAFSLAKKAELTKEVKDWQEAATAYIRAIEWASDSGLTPVDRPAIGRALAQWPELFRQVSEQREESALWLGRGQFRSLHKQWEEAAADYARIIHLRPLSSNTIEYAFLLAYLDDTDAYQQFCRSLLNRMPADTTVTQIDQYYSLASAMVAGPADCVSSEKIVDWARKGVQNSPHGSEWHTVALAQLRAKKFEDAIESLDQSQMLGGYGEFKQNKLAISQNLAIRAMALCHLGRAEEANECLQTAQQHVVDVTASNTQLKQAKLREWTKILAVDWICAHVILKEAKALLAGDPKSTVAPDDDGQQKLPTP